jgi:hypothetical protein
VASSRPRLTDSSSKAPLLWSLYKVRSTPAKAKALSSVHCVASRKAVAASSSKPTHYELFGGEGLLTMILRKHMKRHTRPYVCTFPDCNSRHGSRSDWKRHEESQHPLQESWKCTARLPDGTGCFADFTSEGELQRHLIVSHGWTAMEVSPEFCEHMHLGNNATGRFWCPFCRDVIATEPKSSCDWREMRLQHIGDHFDRQD